MFFAHAIELRWIQQLQHFLRGPFLDIFFQCSNYIDTLPFAFVAIAILWHLIDKDIGIKVFYLAIISMLLNIFLKSFFQSPRPCHLDPGVGLFCPLSYGFPSGAAQTAYLIVGVTWLESQKRLYRAFSVVFATILCFSRIYLGVHFFSDVIGGLLVGSLIIWLYARYLNRIQDMGPGMYFLLPLICFYLNQFFYCGLTLGVALGLTLNKKVTFKRESFKKRFLNFFTVILGSSLMLSLHTFSPELNLLIALLNGLWFSYLAVYLTDTLVEHFLYRPCLGIYKSKR
ncbi:MAG: phosphatase PAP2 family protein [Parachlamydiaceae bacterium]